MSSVVSACNKQQLNHVDTGIKKMKMFLWIFFAKYLSQCNSFSINQKNDLIKASIIDNASINGDVTAMPVKSTELLNCKTVSYSSDFVSQEVSFETYITYAKAIHDDCISLFDSYETALVRCEALDETSINVRWNATWIPVGSSWLYNFASLMKWDIIKKNPDPYVYVVFSWSSVFNLFQSAFATNQIALPISLVEGNTIIGVSNESGTMTIKETVDLVSEADKNRLQNRRVAQELASWLDVRRPPDVEQSIDADEWAGMVRQRILSGVAGAGALDIDPNKDGEADIALVIFGLVSLAALTLSFQYFLVPEIVGGVGRIPSKCDDAAILEFGSGYSSECFGPFGDPAYK